MILTGQASNMPMPGDMVEVIPGTVVSGTHPRRSRWVTSRTMRVTIIRVGPGTGEPRAGEDVGAPAVAWLGSGGYWCEADLRDVRRIEPATSVTQDT